MLRSRNVTAGKYYVNNARKIAREVLAIDDQTVTFNTYHLDTGNSCSSPSQCTKRDFVHWADHEATPFEMASLQNRQMEVLLYAPQFPDQEMLYLRAIDPFPG
jgi:hypothetical protein